MVLVAGCDVAVQTPEQKYETALHIFTMERARYEALDADEQRNSTDQSRQRAADQSARLKRARTSMDEAYEALK